MVYPSNRVEFTTDLSENGESLLQFVCVGDEGVPYRCYTKCCGSQVNNATFPQLIAMNANGVLNADGSKHDRGEVLNIKVSDSFTPDLVPEPNHQTLTTGVLLGFVSRLMNPAHPKKLDKRYKELFVDKSECEVVPITWEGEVDHHQGKKVQNIPEGPVGLEGGMNASYNSGMSISC